MSQPVVTVPSDLVQFLEERGSVGVAATRDRSLRPRAHGLSGWFVTDEARELVCLVSRGFTEGLLPSLEENGQFAAAFEHIGPHETYQFKGSYAGSRPPTPEDHALWERLRARFAASLKGIDPNMGLTDAWLRDYIPPPEIVVRMRVREIFLQTPGPGAGRRLVPPEGA
jgi:hypothetical protein